MTPEDRFWSKVYRDEETGCWMWMAADNGAGYGVFYLGGRLITAHRVAYEWSEDSIPDGLHLDHLCRVTKCVNPSHLEPVTMQENLRRAPYSGAQAMRDKTHCPHGHGYTPENTYSPPAGGRYCRACAQIRQVRRRERGEYRKKAS